MSSRDENQRKRPPPISIPALPASRKVTESKSKTSQANQNGPQQRQRQDQRQQQQYEAKIASATLSQSSWPPESSPLKSPLDRNASGIATSQSLVSNNGTAHSDPVDKARVPSQRSKYGSTGKRQRQPPRYSDPSNRGEATISDQVERRAEKTGRAKIEAKKELKLFKMTGQIPSTPPPGAIEEDRVCFRTEDLRAQCQNSNRDTPDHDELAKSPKKTLFGNLRNAFNKTPVNAPPPPMPSKAAQILGTAPRDLHKVEPRAIRTPENPDRPEILARSDTTKSLPDKIGNSQAYAQHYGRSLSRQSRTARKSPGKGNTYFGDTENRPLMPHVSMSSESTSPPTPPAKDTPRKTIPTPVPSSPLRRTRPSDQLREAYGAPLEYSVKLPPPNFAVSPSLYDATTPKKREMSPTEYHTGGYSKHAERVEDECSQWAYSEAAGSNTYDYGIRALSLGTRNQESVALPHGRESKVIDFGYRNIHYSNSAKPNSSALPDVANIVRTEGESGFPKANGNHLLLPAPSETDSHCAGDSSNQGSIEMIYQGDANDIDPSSSTARLINSANTLTTPPADLKEPALVFDNGQGHLADVAQSLTPQGNGQSNYYPLQNTPTTLNEMLNSLNQGNFVSSCASAVQSPLNNTGAPFVQSPPNRPDQGPFRPAWQPRTPNTVDEHFYMTNEHLDVVGKTTWDLLETAKQQNLTILNARQDQISALVEKRFEDIKSQIAASNEMAESASKKHDDLFGSFEKLYSYITQDIADTLASHEKKTAALETQVTELQKTVQTLRQWLEQKFTDIKPGFPVSTFSNPNTPLPMHRSQHAMAGYYGNGPEYVQENQSPMPNLHDNRSTAPMHETHHDHRIGHSNGYGQQWGRQGYTGRISKEDRTPYGAPYPFGGQFNNGYAPGYSNYGFSANLSEQHSPFDQGTPK